MVKRTREEFQAMLVEIQQDYDSGMKRAQIAAKHNMSLEYLYQLVSRGRVLEVRKAPDIPEPLGWVHPAHIPFLPYR